MILMDSTVASGAAAIMAMRVLVEHDVPEDNIILISLIMAVQGVHSVAYAYPSVSTTSADFFISYLFSLSSCAFSLESVLLLSPVVFINTQ